MKRLGWRHSFLAATIAVWAAVVAAAQPRFDAAITGRLKASALNGRALAYATDLTQTIGARLSGSQSYDRAAQWAAAQFAAAGATGVTLQPFTIPHAWERVQRGRARMIAPFDRPLVVESFGWAPSAPETGIEADVVLGDRELIADPGRARGRIVLVPRDLERHSYRQLQQGGALALLFSGGGADNEIAARVWAFDGEIAPLPMALLSGVSVETLREALGRGPVRLSLAFQNRISDGPATLSNVIAEVVGRERPDEFVVVGAHLDSWDFATGAQDNATGVAMVLEAARAIAALGRAPRRSIRFALFGAEEQGLLGSTAYVQAHERELDRCVAMLNADGGTARIIGWTTPGRDDVMTEVRRLSKALLKDLRADRVDRSMQYAFDSDGGPFIRQGIPTLDMNVDDEPYEQIHHKATDTIDRVNARNLATGAAMLAVTAYTIADAPQRIAPRGPRRAE